MSELSWQQVIKKVSDENQGLPLKEILKKASPIYKNQKNSKSNIVSKNVSSKGRKPVSSSTSKQSQSSMSSSSSKKNRKRGNKKNNRKTIKRKRNKKSASSALIV